MKTMLLLLLLQLSPLSVEESKEKEIEEILNKIYNHSHLLSADKEAERMTKILLEKYPEDPYVYDLWASTEWLLIGRELDLKLDEQKDLSVLNGYKERSEKYRQLVDKGLILTEGKMDEKMLFARAALYFDQAKFSARYENRLTGLKRADKEAAEGAKILRQLLASNPKFCSAYLFLGANRFQLSTKPNALEKLVAWKFSKVYAELYTIDTNVFDENKSIQWLEIAYQCNYPRSWLKKTWLETNFFLIGAYREHHKKMGLKEEMDALSKETALLKKLVDMFPQNQDLAQIASERELRQKTLRNFFSKK